MESLLFPLMLVLLAVPLFLSARKQKRAVAEQQALLKSLEPGDRIMTTSGLFATVADASDDTTIDLEVAPGVVTTWLRQAVREKVVAEDGTTDAVVDDVEDDTAATEQDVVAQDVKEPAQQDIKK
jgi:preprotein translocase subunit YajC